jgi:hypothetical protein
MLVGLVNKGLNLKNIMNLPLTARKMEKGLIIVLG